VKNLSLILSYPRDDPNLQSALRAQLGVVVTQCQRLYPNVDKLCLDLPDDGKIYDLMKSLVPKWKGLEGTTLGIKEGKIVLEKCAPGSSTGSNSKGRSRTVTKGISTSSSIAADVTSSPVLTMQEKERPIRPAEHLKAKVEATEILVDGGKTMTTPQATNNSPVIPSSHPEMKKEKVQPLQVPTVARNSTGESEINENVTFSTQYTRRNLTEEEVFIQNEMMNNSRSSREGVPTTERYTNLSYDNANNEWAGQDNFRGGSYATPVVWDHPSSSSYHPEFRQSPYSHYNRRRGEYHMSGTNGRGRGWNGGPRRRPRRDRGVGHSRHFIPLGKMPERMP